MGQSFLFYGSYDPYLSDGYSLGIAYFVCIVITMFGGIIFSLHRFLVLASHVLYNYLLIHNSRACTCMFLLPQHVERFRGGRNPLANIRPQIFAAIILFMGLFHPNRRRHNAPLPRNMQLNEGISINSIWVWF